jgi:hypothetical protein
LYMSPHLRWCPLLIWWHKKRGTNVGTNIRWEKVGELNMVLPHPQFIHLTPCHMWITVWWGGNMWITFHWNIWNWQNVSHAFATTQSLSGFSVPPLFPTLT